MALLQKELRITPNGDKSVQPPPMASGCGFASTSLLTLSLPQSRWKRPKLRRKRHFTSMRQCIAAQPAHAEQPTLPHALSAWHCSLGVEFSELPEQFIESCLLGPARRRDKHLIGAFEKLLGQGLPTPLRVIGVVGGEYIRLDDYSDIEEHEAALRRGPIHSHPLKADDPRVANDPREADDPRVANNQAEEERVRQAATRITSAARRSLTSKALGRSREVTHFSKSNISNALQSAPSKAPVLWPHAYHSRYDIMSQLYDRFVCSAERLPWQHIHSAERARLSALVNTLCEGCDSRDTLPHERAGMLAFIGVLKGMENANAYNTRRQWLAYEPPQGAFSPVEAEACRVLLLSILADPLAVSGVTVMMEARLDSRMAKMQMEERAKVKAEAQRNRKISFTTSPAHGDVQVGQLLLYKHRHHSWLFVKVVSIDHTGAAPTYKIEAPQFSGVLKTGRGELFTRLPDNETLSLTRPSRGTEEHVVNRGLLDPSLLNPMAQDGDALRRARRSTARRRIAMKILALSRLVRSLSVPSNPMSVRWSRESTASRKAASGKLSEGSSIAPLGLAASFTASRRSEKQHVLRNDERELTLLEGGRLSRELKPPSDQPDRV